MSAKRQAIWNPLDNVGKTVDALLETTPSLDPPRNKGGRPRIEGRRRIVLYLDESQVRNLKLRAVEDNTDVSTVARSVLREVGL